MSVNGQEIEIDSRPSDALALSVRAHVPVFVSEDVMQEAASVPEDELESEDLGEGGEERLEVFKDFVETLDLDDHGIFRGQFGGISHTALTSFRPRKCAFQPRHRYDTADFCANFRVIEMADKSTNSNEGQSIPHNREAEEAVLGSVLVNTEVYYDLAHFLSEADDFFLHRNQWIWEAFTNLQEQTSADRSPDSRRGA